MAQGKKIDAEVLGPLSRWEKAYEAVQVWLTTQGLSNKLAICQQLAQALVLRR